MNAFNNDILRIFSRPYLRNGRAYGTVVVCRLFVHFFVTDVLWLHSAK